MVDYYKILGVSEDATQKQIDAAHKKFYIQNHPDRFKDPVKKKQAEEKCKKINEAYDVLSNPQKRQQYKYEQQGFNHNYNTGSNFQFEQDFDFSSFFGGRHEQQKQKQQKEFNVDVYLTLQIDLRQAYYGHSATVEYDRHESCSNCNARGYTQLTSCRSCRGSGYINVVITVISCMSCNGSGEVGIKCKMCNGACKITKKHKCVLLIPAKTYNEQVLKFKLKGHTIQSKTGSLILKILVKPYKDITFDNSGNLYTTKKVELDTILRREKIELVLFDDVIPIALPRYLDSMTKLTIEKKGLNYKDTLKNLYVTLNVVYPLVSQ